MFDNTFDEYVYYDLQDLDGKKGEISIGRDGNTIAVMLVEESGDIWLIMTKELK